MKLEQRTQGRRHPSQYMEVFEGGIGLLIGHVVDITSEGFRIFGERPVDTEGPMNLRMIPPTVDYGGAPVDLQATPMWCMRSPGPELEGYYDSGFRFDSVSPGDRATIEQLMQESFAAELKSATSQGWPGFEPKRPKFEP